MAYIFKKNLERVAFYVSVFSLIMIIFGFSIPLGALALIMALMSRGSGELGKQGRLALGLSTAAIVIGLLVYAYSFYIILSGQSGTFNDLLQLYEELYG